MQRINTILFLFFVIFYSAASAITIADSNTIFTADHPNFRYTGRVDFTNKKLPRFWSPGVYITAKFTGTFCELLINDQELWGKNHNYVEIVLDGKLSRIQTNTKNNHLVIAKGLADTTHTLVICKNTESNIGWLEFVGLKCKQLLPLVALPPSRKIEFIGNSITCGTGSDQSAVPCGKGLWQDQHNAYLSYGPLVARHFDAQWQLTAVSGIGLMHSCCGMTTLMPEVFNKIDLRGDSLLWNFKLYQPDVLTVCLGQNDGVQDSIQFCNNYVKFIGQLRKVYPATEIILLSSPMADEKLTAVLKKYLAAIQKQVVQQGDKKLEIYFYAKQYHNGCDGHPDLAEHQQIANELIAFIGKLMRW